MTITSEVEYASLRAEMERLCVYEELSAEDQARLAELTDAIEAYDER